MSCKSTFTFTINRRRNYHDSFYVKSVSKDGLVGYFADRDQPLKCHVESLRKEVELKKHVNLLQFDIEIQLDEKDAYVYYRDNSLHFFEKNLIGSSQASLDKLYKREASKIIRIENFKRTMLAKKNFRKTLMDTSRQDSDLQETFAQNLEAIKQDHDKKVKEMVEEIRKTQMEKRNLAYDRSAV